MWLSLKILVISMVTSCVLLQSVRSQEQQLMQDSTSLSPEEVESLLNFIYSPSELYALQRAALRQQIRNILDQSGGEDDNYSYTSDKRSVHPMVRNSGGQANFYSGGKRSLAALARTGQILHTNQNSYSDLGVKRSLAALAKTGQLPSREPEAEEDPSGSDVFYDEEKRSLGSLARSGNLMNGKRNLAALMRNDMLPLSTNTGHKKSIASLARGNLMPGIKRDFIEEERRNIATMARDWALPKQKNTLEPEKRNLGALKNSPVHGSSRQKRDISYLNFDNAEIPESVMQTGPIDYEELLEKLSENSLQPSHMDEKRFLGSVARGGWTSSYLRQPSVKRHIGALARLGQYRSLFRPSMQKRHIGALARADSPSHYKTDINYLSPAFVDGAAEAEVGPAAGQPRAFSTGALRRDLPLFSGATFAQPTSYFHNSIEDHYSPLLIPQITSPDDYYLLDDDDADDDEEYGSLDNSDLSLK